MHRLISLEAHLVAIDFTQIEDIDYEDTFSSTIRPIFICLLLALLVHSDPEFFQMNVKATFLSANLNKEIYIDQPTVFIFKG